MFPYWQNSFDSTFLIRIWFFITFYESCSLNYKPLINCSYEQIFINFYLLDCFHKIEKIQTASYNDASTVFKGIPVIFILTSEFIYAICWYILQGVLPIYWQYWWDTLYIYICGLQNVFGSASLRVEAITHATLGCFLVSSIIGGYVSHLPSGQSKVLKQIFF